MTSYPSLEVLARPGRKRRFGPKVRTGCITCRQRRVKCDEAKPACNNCTKFGRLCDGYTQPLDLPLSGYELQDKPAPSSVTPTYKDRQIFNLLRTVTVRQIAAGINTEFWSTNVLQAATINPAIWHASLALSAMHQRMMMTAGKTNNTQYLADDYYQFALAQYNTSSHYTRQLLQRQTLSRTEKEELLMTGVLYAGISFLQRNMPEAILHARNTLKIYHSWRFWEYLKEPPARNGRTVIGTRHILHLASDIYFALRAFGVEIPDEVGDQFTKTVEASNEPFESITEAYYEYLPILRAQITGTAQDEVGKEVLPSENTIQLRKRAFVYWDQRFEAFTHTPAYQKANPDTIQTLKLLRSVEDVFAAVSLDRTPETWARFHPRWREIIDEAEELLLRLQQADNPGVFLPRFTYSLSLLEVFRLVGLLSRDGQLRFRIIEILRNWPLRDGLLDSQIVLTNIETKMIVENGAILEAPGWCACIPNIFVCADHRVSRFATEIPDETTVIYHVRTGLDFRLGRPGRSYIYTLR